MKNQFSISILLMVGSMSLAGQTLDVAIPPSSRIESRQGQPGRQDAIGHKRVSKGTSLKCIEVEHHLKQGEDGAACLVRFERGDKYTLKHGESMQAPKDSEVDLECLGDKPTRCIVGVW
jgi:hypothetical protein